MWLQLSSATRCRLIMLDPVTWWEASKNVFDNVLKRLTQCVKWRCSSWNIFGVSIFQKLLREAIWPGFLPSLGLSGDLVRGSSKKAVGTLRTGPNVAHLVISGPHDFKGWTSENRPPLNPVWLTVDCCRVAWQHRRKVFVVSLCAKFKPWKAWSTGLTWFIRWCPGPLRLANRKVPRPTRFLRWSSLVSVKSCCSKSMTKPLGSHWISPVVSPVQALE